MLDSQTLGRITKLSFALRHRLLEICEVPDDAMTSNQRFREEFVARAMAADGIPQQDIDNIRRGVFSNLALMNVALKERRFTREIYRVYLLIHRFCRHAQTKGTEEMEDFVFDEKVLESWEKLLS